MDFSKISHLPLAAVLATAIMVGMPALARLQPRVAADAALKNRPPTFPAAGTLLFEGMPVKAALVVFVPEPDRNGREYAAFGTTDDAGRFFLRTFNTFGDGAVAGIHRVQVECMVPTGRIMDDPAHADTGGHDAVAAGSVSDAGGGATCDETLGYPEMRNTLPGRFADHRTSGLTAEVVTYADNEYTIRLHAEPPAAERHAAPAAP